MKEYTEDEITTLVKRKAAKHGARVSFNNIDTKNPSFTMYGFTSVLETLTELKDLLIMSNWNCFLGCPDNTIHINRREYRSRAKCAVLNRKFRGQ